MLTRRTVLAALATPALARASKPLRLGVLTTLAGPAADGAGPGSVLAARMAVEDGPVQGVTILTADMGDRPDQGAAIAREWLDREGVHAIIDVPNSATALAVASIVRERDRIALFSGAGSTALTRSACSPNHLQWTYDTAALATACGEAVLAEGGDTWFFLTADYVFGHSLQADITAVITPRGGRVLGAALFPAETADFSPLLLQAQASGARVVALACAGVQFETLIKQAAEFGLARPNRTTQGQTLASPLALTTNVHAIGLDNAQGLLVTAPFYWDLSDATRAFTARFAPRNRGIPPTMVHAGVYAATTHLLATIAAGADPAHGAATIAAMKRLRPASDLFPAAIRADGGVSHPMHLFRVKSPGEVSGPWDLYRPLRTLAPAAASPAACVLPG